MQFRVDLTEARVLESEYCNPYSEKVCNSVIKDGDRAQGQGQGQEQRKNHTIETDQAVETTTTTGRRISWAWYRIARPFRLAEPQADKRLWSRSFKLLFTLP